MPRVLDGWAVRVMMPERRGAGSAWASEASGMFPCARRRIRLSGSSPDLCGHCLGAVPIQNYLPS